MEICITVFNSLLIAIGLHISVHNYWFSTCFDHSKKTKTWNKNQRGKRCKRKYANRSLFPFGYTAFNFSFLCISTEAANWISFWDNDHQNVSLCSNRVRIVTGVLYDAINRHQATETERDFHRIRSVLVPSVLFSLRCIWPFFCKSSAFNLFLYVSFFMW